MKTVSCMKSRVAYASNEVSPPSDVIALTIISETPGTISGYEVLLGVRRPESNRNHHNVVSVPTKRISRHTFAALLECLPPIEATYTGGQLQTTSCSQEYCDVVTEVVESILARKLGVAGNLENRQIAFLAQPIIMRQGSSPLIVEGDQAELIRMINIVVYLSRGREFFPTSTESYSKIGWFDAMEVVENIDSNKDFEFSDSRAQYICGGMCMCTARALLKALDLK